MMAFLARWLRRLRGGLGTDLVPGEKRVAERDWVVCGSYPSAALGTMYADILQQAGIPVVRQEWGGGSAMLGGVPVGVSLLVPRDRLAEAREILGVDEAEREVGS